MPLLPFYVNDTGAGGVWLGVILTLQSLGVVFGAMLMGFASDKFGRRRTGIFSMFGDALFFLLSAWAPTPLALATVRFCAGLCCPIPVGYGWYVVGAPRTSPPAICARQAHLCCHAPPSRPIP